MLGYSARQLNAWAWRCPSCMKAYGRCLLSIGPWNKCDRFRNFTLLSKINFTPLDKTQPSVIENHQTNYGKLFFADIKVMKRIPEGSEMDFIILSDNLPEKLTYEYIQTKLFEKALEYAISNSFISS
jgi:hypothetical protein